MNIRTQGDMDKEEVEKIWRESEKTQIRVSIPTNLAEYIDQEAVKNWKIDRAARAKEVTKLLLIAREKEEE